MNAVDTNVLVYAYDESSPQKRARARELLTTLADTVLLWQAACEFIAASRKTLGPGGDPGAPWERLSELRGIFPLITPTAGVLDRAAAMQKASRAQFWDCMIYAACQEAGVTRLYSEDVPGGAIEGLSIVDPFR